MNSVRLRTWWDGPAGGREVLQVALPLVVSSLSWTVMTFIDRMFLRWESGDAMSAAFSASSVWFTMACLPLGICAYVNTFVAQYHGDHQTERIGCVVWQGVWIAILATPLAVASRVAAPWLFEAARHSPTLTDLEIRYFRALALGAPALWIAQALAAFYGGRGLARVNMWIDAAIALINVALDYLWIFGEMGFPAMGISGAGWATSVSLWLKAAVYVVLILRRANRERYATLTGMRIDVPLLRRLVRFGAPSGMQMVLDVMGFTVFILLVARLGKIEAEATSMAFSVSTLAFMPIWGISMATSILVGQRLGEDRDDLAERATWNALAIALVYMGTISLWYIFAPGLLLYGFFAGTGEAAADAAAVELMARQLLCFVAAYNLFDALLMIMVGAIKGAGDTAYVLRVSLLMAIALAGVAWLSIETFQWGIYASWMAITVWVWVGGLVYLQRFRHGAWRSMRVIEGHQPPAEYLTPPLTETAT